MRKFVGREFREAGEKFVRHRSDLSCCVSARSLPATCTAGGPLLIVLSSLCTPACISQWAGVRYRNVTPQPDEPGSAWRQPCKVVTSERGLRVLAEYGPQGTCDKYEEPSEEEIAASEEEEAKSLERALERMIRVAPLIAKIRIEHKGESWQGIENCPECGGKLHLRHAALNGHVWCKCETEGCLAWME